MYSTINGETTMQVEMYFLNKALVHVHNVAGSKCVCACTFSEIVYMYIIIILCVLGILT